jgi:hypothetical protein
MDAAKERLAKHALQQEIIRQRRRKEQDQAVLTSEYLHAAPRVVEALEGSIVLRRCVLNSEVCCPFSIS